MPSISSPKETSSTVPPDYLKGDFNADGSWSFKRTIHSRYWYAIDALVAARRRHDDLSPAAFLQRMMLIPSWPLVEGMISAAAKAHWPTLTEPANWREAMCSKSADAAIKYEGRGPDGWHWEGCHCVPNDREDREGVHPPDCGCPACRVWD